MQFRKIDITCPKILFHKEVIIFVWKCTFSGWKSLKFTIVIYFRVLSTGKEISHILVCCLWIRLLVKFIRVCEALQCVIPSINLNLEGSKQLVLRIVWRIYYEIQNFWISLTRTTMISHGLIKLFLHICASLM